MLDSIQSSHSVSSLCYWRQIECQHFAEELLVYESAAAVMVMQPQCSIRQTNSSYLNDKIEFNCGDNHCHIASKADGCQFIAAAAGTACTGSLKPMTQPSYLHTTLHARYPVHLAKVTWYKHSYP